jgi:hypothetical protein
LSASPGRSLADVFGAFGCGIAGLHSTLGSPGLEFTLGLLQAALPLPLSIDGNADEVYPSTQLYRSQPLCSEPADVVAIAELGNRERRSSQRWTRFSNSAHAAPPLLGEATQ